MYRQLIVLLFSFPVFILQGLAQEKDDILITLQGDLVKTDYSQPFEKVQAGAEVHYFPIRTLAASTGFEIWTADEISFMAGVRWYPREDVFIRGRALIGANDINIGAGWVKPISPALRFEAIGDFYFSVDFAIRVGLVYSLRRSE